MNKLTRLVVVGGCLVGLGGCAQKRPARSFSELSARVKPGQTLLVTEAGGQEVSGELATLSASSLTLLQGGGVRNFAADTVQRVRKRGDSVLNGALIGLGAGFGVGILSARAAEPSGSSYVDAIGGGANVLEGVVVGTGLGILVDALIRSPVTVYVGPIAPASIRGPAPSAGTQRSVQIVWRFYPAHR